MTRRALAIAGFLVAGLGAAALVRAPALLGGAGPPERRAAPYRLPVLPPRDVDAEIAFHEARLARGGPEGLELAALAGAYLRKARVTGKAIWRRRAEAAARQAFEALPHDNPEALLVLARVAQARHDFPEAIRLARRVLDARPGDAPALAVLATANVARGSVIEALRAADAWIERRPGLASYAHRAVALAACGRDAEALHDFERGIDLEDVGEIELSAWARTMVARQHLERGRLEAARELLVEALRIVPGYAPALSQLGDLHLSAGDLEAAERAYADAFDRTGAAAFLARRAQARSLRGDAQGAAELRGRAEAALEFEIEAGDAAHRRDLARLLLERGGPGDAPRALALLEEDARARRDATTLEMLAAALLRVGRPREAHAAVREALDSGARSASLYARAAEIERALGNESRAKLYDRLAREVDPRR